ncbi:MAG: MFS transporter [Pseudomonadota bacterium]
MEDQADRVRWREILNAEFGLPLFIICFGVTLHALDELLVATMLPAMVAELGGLNLVSWTVGAYEIGTVVFSAMSGLITVRYGVRIPMFFSATVFGLGCTISAVAPNMETVLLGRAFQGFGGGGLLAISFIASAVLFPEHTLARAMGAISVFWGSAGFVGPLLGSVFVNSFTWRTGFWCFGLAAFLLLPLILLRIKDKNAESRDQAQDETTGAYPWLRIICLTLGIFLVAAAGVRVTAVASPLLIVSGLLFIVVFFRLDSCEHKNRMLPRRPLHLREPIGSALAMIVCLAAATVALPVYGALILKSIHGASPMTAGYVIACPAIGWATATFLVSGQPEERDRTLIQRGILLAVLGNTGVVYTIPNGPIALVALCALVEGVGFGIAWAFIPRLIRHLSEAGEVERNTAAIPTAQAIGYALGAACIGIIGNWSGVADGQVDDISYFSASIIFLACVPVGFFGLLSIRTFVR